MRTMATTALIIAVCLGGGGAPAGHQVAITIDDLPRGGDGGSHRLADVRAMTARLLTPFREQKIPVTGFVNQHQESGLGAAGLRQVLDQWLDAGATLGNHTYSHLEINQVSLDAYTADIVKGEPILKEALAARGQKLIFFRHPFLHTGPTPEKKKGMAHFLARRGYTVAPVTIDNSDYMYARLYTNPAYRERVRREYVPYMESVTAFFETRGVEVAGHDFPHVLLIHASELNADLMPDLLVMFKRRGYTIVSLEQALKDDAYRMADEYTGTSGFSWVHRWSKTKGLPPKGEPDPPAWVMQAFNAR